MAKLPVVSTCCGCFSLKGGVLFLGYYSAISGVFYILTSLFAVCNPEAVAGEYGALFERLGGELPKGFENWVYYSSIATIVFSVLFLICGVCLIKGVKNDNKTLLLPWLTIMVFSVIIVTICAIVSLFYVPVAIGIFLFISLVLDLYLMLCVHALYEQMGGNSRYIV